MILDIDEDVEAPLNRGWPFLAICRALIDIIDSKLVLRVEDEEVVSKLLDVMKHSLD